MSAAPVVDMNIADLRSIWRMLAMLYRYVVIDMRGSRSRELDEFETTAPAAHARWLQAIL